MDASERHTLKYRTFFQAGLCALALAGCSNEARFGVVLGDPADILNEKRLVLINYWATWCVPCIEEMPELARFRERNHDSVEIYAVNFDNPEIEELRRQIQKFGVGIPSLMNDPSRVLGYSRPNVLPTTVVVREGEVVDVLVGQQTYETLEQIQAKWEK